MNVPNIASIAFYLICTLNSFCIDLKMSIEYHTNVIFLKLFEERKNVVVYFPFSLSLSSFSLSLSLSHFLKFKIFDVEYISNNRDATTLYISK